MRRTKPVAAPMVARVYLRVSTDAQDLERQEAITTAAKAAGYYVAGIYREKASGARADRPELLRMIGDLQPGEVVIAEKIDRISRLPCPRPSARWPRYRPKAQAWPSPAWSISSDPRPRPVASPRSCWKPCRSCFSPGLADGPRRLRGQARTPAPRH